MRREAAATSNRQQEGDTFPFPQYLFRSDYFSRTFFQDLQSIRWQIVETFHESARPAHLHRFGFGGGTEAEMYTQVILRNIAGAAAHFVDERSLAVLNTDFCANSVTI